jgi:hypothetical protein
MLFFEEGENEYIEIMQCGMCEPLYKFIHPAYEFLSKLYLVLYLEIVFHKSLWIWTDQLNIGLCFAEICSSTTVEPSGKL